MQTYSDPMPPHSVLKAFWVDYYEGALAKDLADADAVARTYAYATRQRKRPASTAPSCLPCGRLDYAACQRTRPVFVAPSCWQGGLCSAKPHLPRARTLPAVPALCPHTNGSIDQGDGRRSGGLLTLLLRRWASSLSHSTNASCGQRVRNARVQSNASCATRACNPCRR